MRTEVSPEAEVDNAGLTPSVGDIEDVLDANGNIR